MASRQHIRTAIAAALGAVMSLLFAGAAFAQDAGKYPN